MLYFWQLHELGNGGWIAAMVFAIAGGLRLALRRLVADGAVRGMRVTPRQDLLLLLTRGKGVMPSFAFLSPAESTRSNICWE